MDAIVIGSGPNGLAAAITLARRGCSVAIYEAGDSVGGGLRSAQVTLPGFTHDICATVLALAADSPFFQSLPLDQHGLEWCRPDIPLAHPLEDGSAAVLGRSLEQTCKGLGTDGPAYHKLMSPWVDNAPALLADVLGPLQWPRHPVLMARFGFYGLRSCTNLAQSLFKNEPAQALWAGICGHAIMPLEHPLTSSFGLILSMVGHTHGWPFARGGSGRLAQSLANYAHSLGIEIITGKPVTSIQELPTTKAIVCDTSARSLLQLAGERLPPRYKKQLGQYRYGPGVFKMDWALSGPIPWKAEACKRAGTVHLGGALAEIAQAEQQVWQGHHPDKPFVILTQPSLFDASRAPAGKHTAWAYCHVPSGSTQDMSAPIEAQIERFAPGFRSLILSCHTMTAQGLEAYNPNYIGGDINGGIQDLRQLYFRPALRRSPYTAPAPGLYLCSSCTPPGGGVHGMCGYHAAQAVLRKEFHM